MPEYEPSCPLCRLWHDREIITPLHYEDDICISVDCSVHRIPQIVLKRHAAEPTPEELQHINEVAQRLWPNVRWRPPASIPQHFHLHSV